jgi:hypothetical protein
MGLIENADPRGSSTDAVASEILAVAKKLGLAAMQQAKNTLH